LSQFVSAAAATVDDREVRVLHSTTSELSVRRAPPDLVTRGWRARSPVARRATRGSTAGWTRPGAGTIVAGTPSRRRGPAGGAAWTAGEASRRPGAEAGDTDTSTTT